MNWSRLGRYGMWSSAVFSVAAFAISLYTFWYNFVQPADLSVSVARTMSFGRNSDTGFQTFNMPLTFVNNGGQNAVVDLISVTVHGPGDAEPRVWDAEDRVNEYSLSGPFAPLDVPARKSVTQGFRFNPLDRADAPIFYQPGVYRLEIAVHRIGGDTPEALSRYTQIEEDDLPYIRQILQRWPLIFDVVTRAEDLEPGRSYLRRW